MHLVMFLKNFPEACKIQLLVVLQQDEAEVELTESQLQMMQVPHLQTTNNPSTLYCNNIGKQKFYVTPSRESC